MQPEVELWLLFPKNRELMASIFLYDESMIMYHLVIEKNVVKLKLNDCFKLNNKSFQITFKYYMICLKVCNNIF